MKKLLIILLLFGAWKTIPYSVSKTEPLYDEPYVVVYGRNSCGFTQKTLKDLKAAGIAYEYKLVDKQPIADVLHSRMDNSGLDISRYNLPVVDVNNNLSIRPEFNEVIKTYNEPLTQ